MSGIRNKVVIITGASSGIGAATARRLAHWGARLMLAARREDRLRDLVAEIAEYPGTAAAYRCDVTQRRHMEELAEATGKQYGRIDVLVNNAGIMPLSMLGDTKVDEWDQCIDVNVKGVLYGIAAVLPRMYEQGRGHVINVSSVAGHKVFPSSAVYSGSKFAVRAISEGLRQEAGEHGVRSTIISPGAIRTELTGSISDENIRGYMESRHEEAIDPEAIASAIGYAIEQPYEVDVNEILVRPTAQKG